MLSIINSVKDTKRKAEYDLKHIVEWLRANRISLKSAKAVPIIIRSKNEKLPKT